MTPCELCGGKLLAPCRSDIPMSFIPPEDFEPCPRCLSVPVDKGLRGLARVWLGFSPWHDTHGTIGAPWWLKNVRVLPLYLSGGMDLGTRYAAQRCEFECGTSSPSWYEYEGVWTLEVYRTNGGEFDAKSLNVAHTRIPGQCVNVIVPALADIPAGVPQNLRAARALKLWLESMETTE